MSLTSRRLAGVLIAVALLITIGAFSWWRLAIAGAEGWAGIAYMPGIPQQKAKSMPTIAGFAPGAIFFVYPGGPADRAGIQRSSCIVSINKIPIYDFKSITGLAAQVHAGTTVVYRTRDGKLERDHPVRFASPLETPVFVGMFATELIVALIFLAIGLFVFWRRPSDPRAVIFFAMTLFAAVWLGSGALAPLEAQNLRGLVVASTSPISVARPLAFALAGIFFAPLLLHLALIFPQPRPVVARRRRLFIWIYAYPVYTCVYAAFFIALVGLSGSVKTVRLQEYIFTGFLWSVFALVTAAGAVSLWRIAVHARRSGTKEAIIERPLGTLNVIAALLAVTLYAIGSLCARMHSPAPMIVTTFLLVFLVIASLVAYPVATFIALYRSYRDSGLEERRQVKWPLWGTMIAVGGKILLTIVSLTLAYLTTFRHEVTVPSIFMTCPDAVSKILYIIVPVSFAFAILKYRLMNIDIIIRRTVLYSILTAVIFVLYAVLVAGLGTALVKFAGMRSQTMLIASTVVIALVTVPIRNRLQQMVDRNLFRERRDYPLALRNIGNAISSSSGSNEFLRSCTEQIQQALQNRLVLIALRRDREYVATAKVGIADEVVGNVRVPADLDTTAVPEPLRKLGATLLIPVRTHRESVALLALGSKLSDEEFSPDDVEFLTSAASQIAVGIENLRLRNEEEEFEQARAMQQILLPTRFPQLEGFSIVGAWQPARSVGGDYFDTLSLGNGKAAVCIGDVAGKGMPAALLMANLQAAVKATASQQTAPAVVCERVKSIVGGNLAGGKFITFFYGVLDAAARTFTYSNAGHNPPILVRADKSAERLARGGPAMCRLFKDVPHEQESVALGSGDRIVLFTDGASEARQGEEEFGDDRLIELALSSRHLGARELQERILDTLRTFTGGDFGDDVTLVVVAAD